MALLVGANGALAYVQPNFVDSWFADVGLHAPSNSLVPWLSWEDRGPTVPAYNIYEGAIGSFYSHVPVACHVTGTPEGAGARVLDITTGAGDRYYLVTASDSCGEGSPGRASDGYRRPSPGGSCGPTPRSAVQRPPRLSAS